ncbi:diguanylate cyclase/phosphodiesterase (GGDEF & EAL domains) with PAS/PAC sensor(s) [Halorubrum sp. DM2]|uniref:sensor histidine kinase n=1 Tax=Halorubrum sp. DM2 TaxID=2527867 RepID=UPI0024B790EC|nr:HAMP domain-containing sensor histidine kinase [Halorubrum sp. DM2]VTT87095.1 diguanylate cyclase/phosphodiesterase (GGDEF & EAL domains) with PAS/PAC sensor(s) [Halorubrum sp. DM2]
MRWTRAKNAGQLGLLAALGLVPLGFLLSSLSGMSDPVAVVTGVVVPIVCSALVVLATVPVARSPLSPAYTGFIVAWTALGALTLGAVALLFVSYEMSQGPPPSNPALVIGGAASVGSAFGLAFGLTDARQRWAQGQLERANGQLTVLNRVLRHNIRNAMTVVRGRARFIRQQAEASQRAGADGAGDGLADHAVVVEENAERLLGVSEHARHIDAVIGPDDDVEEVATTVDLVGVAEGAIERLGAEHPAAEFVAPAAVACRVRAHPLTEVAVSELIENAVVHGGDAPRVAVSVRRDGDGATLRVDDDGPGIPPETVEAIQRGYETSMRHADGLGLWLVRWVVDRSVADLGFDADGDGQTVTIRFERVETADGEPSPAASGDPNDLPDADATGGGRPTAATADSP